MDKVAFFQGEPETGPVSFPLHARGDRAFEKYAAPFLLPEVSKYIEGLRPQNNAQYILVNALGASEYFGCFPAGTLVRTSEGDVPIEEVSEGTRVLTHKNRWRTVEATTSKPYSGDLIELYVQGMSQLNAAIRATPNHAFWVVAYEDLARLRSQVFYKGDRSTPASERRGALMQLLPFQWKPLGEVKRGDLVAYPFPLEEDPSALGKAPWLASEEAAFLMGLYAAEGCVARRYGRMRKLRNGHFEQPLATVVFVVGAHEGSTVEKIKSCAGRLGHAAHAYPNEATNSIRVEVSWQELAEACVDHIGSHSTLKELSAAVLRMPREWQRAFFSAYAGGDGYRTRDGSTRCCSASAALLHGMRLLLARQGMVASISGRHNRRASWYNGRPVYELLVGSAQGTAVGRAKSYLHPAGFILSPVTRTNRVPWSGEVFDLQVAEDSSFVAGGFAVHNSNVNGDAFPEASLIHCPPGWSGVPVLDRARSKDWPYGYATFYGAHAFVHHRNKDPQKKVGDVELAAWNPRMKRVELVLRIDKDLCDRFGGTGFWDKLKQGGFPDLSMGSRVPFDTCALCLDKKAYLDAQTTFDKSRHKYVGEAVLEVHRKRPIRGLSITRKDYCEHAAKHMNRILPDGRKVFVYNDYPKFFDISLVFVGADRTAKTMLKIAEDSSRVWSLPGAELAEVLAQDSDEKTASVDPLKLAFLGKRAVLKEGEIVKDSPAMSAKRLIPALTRTEEDLPTDLLDALGAQPLERALSTTAGLGVVLRPREFQRVMLISMGRRSVADDLDNSRVVFSKSDSDDVTRLSTENFDQALARAILPCFAERSALSPVVEKRVVVLSLRPVRAAGSRSSHSSDLLRKIGSAYSGYRQQLMQFAANSQDLLAKVATPSDDSLCKIAAAPVTEVFTELSASYLKLAFWDEVGAHSTANADVERGTPSRNTVTTSQSTSGGHRS